MAPVLTQDTHAVSEAPVSHGRFLTTCKKAVARPVVALALLCATLFFHGLNAGELYRTESLRAILAAEFLRSGNWVVPTLYGEPLLTKPPGMYAAVALASWPAGRVTEMTARLPSAVAATVTVFLFFGTFARLFGKRAGLLAAALLPLSVLWLDRVPTAEIDVLQLAWVAASILCFVRALESAEAPQSRRAGGVNPLVNFRNQGVDTPRSPSAWLWWQGALLCVAGGFLTKWTAPAFFYLTVIPLLGWCRRLRLLWGGAHLTAVAVAAVPCVAWAMAAGSLAGWDVLFGTVGREALQHLSPAHHSRPYPWAEVLTFPLLFLAANLPWSAVALLTFRPGFARLWDERGRRLLQALHCWTWANLLFWSVVPGHRFRHGLPLQPGLAGLAAMVCIAWLTGRLSWPLPRVTPRVVLLGVLAVWLVVKITFVQVILPARNPDRQPREKGEQLAALVPQGRTLYLFRLKDEGILFYYGRPARRLASPAQLQPGESAYCVLAEAEWEQWPSSRPAEVLLRTCDEQGAPLVLVKAY
jgi:4-amino-4-deoxy-L-arabinose transferase-like glycosyltransferase